MALVSHELVARRQDPGGIGVAVPLGIRASAHAVGPGELVGSAGALVLDGGRLGRIEQATGDALDGAEVVVAGILRHRVALIALGGGAVHVAADDPALDGVLDVVARTPHGVERDALVGR